MEDSFYGRKEEQAARESLLRYYSSECVAHGTYILSTILAIFTFFDVFLSREISPWEIWATVSGFVLGAFFTIGIHLLARTLYWGVLTSTILWIIPSSDEEIIERKFKQAVGKASVNLLNKLHYSCDDHIKGTYKTIWTLSCCKLRYKTLLFLVVSILFLFSFVLIPFHLP